MLKRYYEYYEFYKIFKEVPNMPIYRMFTPLPSIVLLENIQKLAHNQDADKDLSNPSNKAGIKGRNIKNNVIYTNRFQGNIDKFSPTIMP